MNKIKCNMKLFGIVTVGPKGQIVIPKDLREKIGLSSGSTLAIMLKDDKYIGLVKNEDMGEIMKYIESEKN
ncbi:MAG: AbrB/MazE/SpoVT family DNA-binding domain-containing protein [Candidatus Gracilibacteria bacterium]|nr:AbrB/MazE/SpoVT family DNA-binding domain-containing protein [Candidatus Gracilibacteria bacterium]